MAFWLVALGMTVLVAAALVRALARARAVRPAAAYDLAVYRDQLREVDRDLARGILSPADAERARLEISRRVLEADRALGAAPAAGPARGGLLAGLALAAAVAVGAFALYSRIGAPGYPDMALKDRLARIEEMRAGRPGQAEAEARTPEVEVLPPGADARYLELVAQLRAKVAERGEDVTGHRLLARHEAALGRFRAARAAQARVVELLGEAAGAQDLADLADLMIVSAGNYVSPEAEAVLVRALQRDPLNGMARYYTGLLFAQTGRPDQALRMWRALVREGPADAPWIPAIRAQIAQVAQMAGELPDLPEPEAAAPAPALPGAPGPSAADVEAAAGLSEDERSAMIRGMVASLDARLAEDGGTLEEWLRLISAWGVLGDEAGRAAALTRAEAAFAADPAALERLRAAAAGAQ